MFLKIKPLVWGVPPTRLTWEEPVIEGDFGEWEVCPREFAAPQLLEEADG
jgi:hypothetical protein